MPRGTKIRIGIAGKNKFCPDGGDGLQYEILDLVRKDWYSNTKLIEGVIRD